MLDIPMYRMHEQLAKAQIPSWRISQRHNLEIFEKVGFPVRISTLDEIFQIIDTMQEYRFEMYMEEFGGLTPVQLDRLVQCLVEIVRFQRIYFPDKQPQVPLSTMLSAMMTYHKVSALKPGFGNVLEIGPGCGYVGVVLKFCHPQLENYTQVEACESFYLLQNWVNTYIYGSQFEQKIVTSHPIPDTTYAQELAGEKKHQSALWAEVVPLNASKKEKTLCRQYPWWGIGDLVRSGVQFDVVISNANLAEFTPAALDDYLSVIKQRLAPDGIFFFQCPGGGEAAGRSAAAWLLQRLADFTFAPLFITLQGHPKGAEIWRQKGNFLNINPNDPRKFGMGNGVFVNEKHPLFGQLYRNESFREGFYAELDTIRNAFFACSPDAKVVSRTEVLDLVRRSL